MSSVRILAPAKLNLGLAILGKRADGYHEIDTIMAMVGLCDEIKVSECNAGKIKIIGMDEVPTQSNLMWKAARLWSNATGIEPAWHIEIAKRIPSPAGIGGGSSDAAAVLKALNHMHGETLSSEQLHDVASQVGADCPFFLHGPCSRATGTGTDIEPITPLSGWAVLLVPQINSQAKTASLYGALTPQDYGDRSSMVDIQNLIAGANLAGRFLPNSFLRPAMEAFPELASLITQLTEVAGHASLSGSGPAIYALTPNENQARSWAFELEQRAASNVAIHVVNFLQEVPAPEVLSD